MEAEEELLAFWREDRDEEGEEEANPLLPSRDSGPASDSIVCIRLFFLFNSQFLHPHSYYTAIVIHNLPINYSHRSRRDHKKT